MKFLRSAFLFSLCIFAATSFTSCSHDGAEKETAQEQTIKNNIPDLLPRKGAIANNQEWKLVQERAAKLRQRMIDNPDDTEAKLLYAILFMHEARITGEHPYYYPYALTMLDEILQKEPQNYFALSSKASVLLSLHHFAEAREVGMKALEIMPNKSVAYGAVCDASVELGDYKQAVEMADQMIALRPELNSYARISYLREIHGDMHGAIESMKLAVGAGMPGSEDVSWARNILAKLYLSNGDIKNAEVQYLLTLEQRPDYPFAVAGLGEIEKIRKNYDKAIEQYEKALAIIPEYSFQDALTDLYAIKGDKEKARASAETTVAMLQEDADAGHHADMELAYAYLKAGNNEKALEHAKIEYARRPENIHTNQAMAWVNYRMGNYADAKRFAEASIRTEMKDPVLQYRAGLIFTKAGEAKKGRQMMEQAVKQNPYLPEELLSENTAAGKGISMN